MKLLCLDFFFHKEVPLPLFILGHCHMHTSRPSGGSSTAYPRVQGLLGLLLLWEPKISPSVLLLGLPSPPGAAFQTVLGAAMGREP